MSSNPKRSMRALMVVVACAVLAVVGCNDDAPTTPDNPPSQPPTEPTSSMGRMRAAQLTQDARTVDVVVDGNTVTQNLAYPGVGGYVDLDEGEHRVQILPAGTTGAAMVEMMVTLEGGESLTVAVVGNDPVALVVVDDGGTSANGANVRLFNAVPDFPANLDLGVVNGPLVVAGVAFMNASDYATVVPGSYALVLKRGGTKEEIGTMTDTLPGATNTTVFAVGSLGRGDIGLISARDAQ
jgi:hypothetical protein